MKKVDEIHTDKSLEKKENSRRTFLKKAAYTAPIVLTLGQLVKPTKVHADSGPPDGPPGGFGGF
ncbi:MAG TPA: hypothetical protein ENJ34_00100 [Epsilonproteobacteria bacterium]|nr:hypothetical protein [Campylobacterota bacterium]